jgi:carboxyl-terminal processing protease
MMTKLFPLTAALTAVLGAAALSGCTAEGTSTTGAVPACAPQPPPQSPQLKPTTVGTLEQAYRCVFERYYSASTLDHRAVLASAFTALTQELQRRGIDRPDVTMPAMTGHRDRDWTAFSAVYQRIKADSTTRQALAEAVMNGMIDALDDNHARWVRGGEGAGGETTGTGITGLSGRQGLYAADPAATSPLFVTSVAEKSPADRAGVRPGDVIVSVNGAPPFIRGELSQQIMDQLNASDGTMRLGLERPSGGREWSVSIAPGKYRPPLPSVSSKLLDGDVAYVKVPGFFPGAADQALKAVARIREGGSLRGVIIDLRGNTGGSPTEVNRLLGAFAHGKTTGYLCDAEETCTASRTDDAVPLLGLRPVLLTDRACASAGDAFAAAFKDLRLGPLVGTRTAGAVSGPNESFPLADGSVLLLPARHHLGPNKEKIDTIGVAADHQAPLTARDLSTGRDPGVDKALSLLP